jgi:hypothetical protein
LNTSPDQPPEMAKTRIDSAMLDNLAIDTDASAPSVYPLDFGC